MEKHGLYIVWMIAPVDTVYIFKNKTRQQQKLPKLGVIYRHYSKLTAF